MDKIHFSYCKKEINVITFLAAWNVLHERSSEVINGNWGSVSTPIHNEAQSTKNLLEKNSKFAHSFEMLCRIVTGAHNGMQVTPEFFEKNAAYIQREDKGAISLYTDNPVNAAKPTQQSIELWVNLPQAKKNSSLAAAEAFFESDQDDDGSIISADEIIIVPEQNKTLALTNPAKYVAEYIQNTHLDIFYRKKHTSKINSGWDEKLAAYFWPSPTINYRESVGIFNALIEQSRTFTLKVVNNEEWSDSDNTEAMNWAENVFAWGGVPQNNYAANDIRNVIQSALKQSKNSTAKMNSGWTKIAAIASEHFPADIVRTVIWDSRVATAIISILDQAFSPDSVPNLGAVNGRGGTRPRALTQKWPNGYRSWNAQVAGSLLVEEIRKNLNTGNYPRMPLPDGQASEWTTRGVEMVLFMSGY